MITSRQNDRIKQIIALQSQTKARRKQNLFVVEGVRLAEEALNANWEIESGLYDETLSDRGVEVVNELSAQGVTMEEVSPEVMSAASDTQNPQGILLVLPIPTMTAPKDLTMLLIPDQLRDPGNLGTLLRSAVAAGAQAAFIPSGSVDVYNPKVVRAGMGAHFQLTLLQGDYAELGALINEHHLQLLIADANGEAQYDTFDLTQPLALVVGGEAEGAGQNIRAIPHTTLSIPMPGVSESLNASVAGSVLLFEAARQRR